jgi:tRNA-dihydrouridine synthase B
MKKRSKFMQLGTKHIAPGAALAPMAGVTDLAFRTICAEKGASFTVSEMVSSRALVYQDKKSLGLMKRNPGTPFGVQLFGNDPEIMAQAAAIVLEKADCDWIDLNMGCPVPKVAANGDGCGLMRTPELAFEIVRRVCQAVPVPVTVKFRLGWDRGNLNAVSFACGVEEAGAAAVAVHGRTRAQQYSGRADWDEIAKVCRAVSIPVIANGDVAGPEDAVRCLQRTGAALVMIGRAAFGDPWVFEQTAAALRGEAVPPRPPLAERVDTAVRQIELAVADKGEHIACLEARKHFAWYLRGVAHAGYYKEKISMLSSLDEVYETARGIKRDLR